MSWKPLLTGPTHIDVFPRPPEAGARGAAVQPTRHSILLADTEESARVLRAVRDRNLVVRSHHRLEVGGLLQLVIIFPVTNGPTFVASVLARVRRPCRRAGKKPGYCVDITGVPAHSRNVLRAAARWLSGKKGARSVRTRAVKLKVLEPPR